MPWLEHLHKFTTSDGKGMIVEGREERGGGERERERDREGGRGGDLHLRVNVYCLLFIVCC